jgi:hypothetical protein
MKRLFSIALVACALPLGCSFEYDPCDTELPIDTASAGSGTETCKEGSLCFDITPLDRGAPRSGTVAVVWYQLDAGDPDPEPFVGYQAEFDAKQKSFSIPLDAIEAPKDEALMLCERACDDEVACGCRSDERIAVGNVIVAQDEDRDGRLDVREVRQSTYGRGYLLIASGEKDYPISPPPADQVFTDGIGRGVHAYRFLGNPEERDARAVRAEPDATFRMNVCSERGCTPPFPEVRID